MPIYEYESEDGERREVFCLASDRPDEIIEGDNVFRRIMSKPMKLETGISQLRDHYAGFREMQKSQGITQDSVDFTH